MQKLKGNSSATDSMQEMRGFGRVDKPMFVSRRRRGKCLGSQTAQTMDE